MYTIGVDIGGTQTRVGLFSDNKLIENSIFATSQNFEEGMENIAKVINEYQEDIVGIGICCPGTVNYQEGIITNSVSLSNWINKSIINALRHSTNIANIQLQNDANLAALGEYYNGEFSGSKILQFFTISTGLGAGLIIDGKIFTGFNGNANEMANFIVSDDEVGYGILVNGSIEASCSGTGIENQARKIGLTKSTKEVFDLYHEGNSDAISIINRSIRRLASLIVNTISFIDPEAIVFSGSVALNNKWFISKAFNYAQTLLIPSMRNKTKWGLSKLEGLGALYGASQFVK